MVITYLLIYFINTTFQIRNQSSFLLKWTGKFNWIIDKLKIAFD
jgi:hypothetical protein